ncbi:CMP-N-acetylneuraminate-poly-alpha-2,8-sialyltransferase-like [Branchiostoma lanceolatum]|uniref:CMP-N-acetylneuraminate-poly-alpha-2, 8-sialyltransferase-like n=1 Tax=Branchiostoma lanceolatum TaxID=7740 RepID=UPI003456ACD1
MADRKAYFRLMASGILLAFFTTILISRKARQPSQPIPVDVSKSRRNLAVSTKYSTISPRTTEARGGYFNRSEAERIRKWIMTYFNPYTDLTINKSQVYPGQRINYEYKQRRKRRKNIGQKTISKIFYRLVPESSPLLGKHFRSCAVVGNSGILLGSRCGRQIDSADFVFRANLAAIEGFENDVGTKSNFTTMNPSVLSHDYAIEGDFNNATIRIRNMFLKRLRLIHDQILHIPAFVSAGGPRAVEFVNKAILKYRLPMKMSYAPSNVNEKLTEMWNDSPFKPNRSSTGCILFVVAACLCDQTHLYGFYPFDKDQNGREKKYHYYGDFKEKYLDPKHVMKEEYRAYQTFHKRKALVLHTEPCNDNEL